MAWNSKVIWSEGMLLHPQHLQQHDRYLHNQLEARVAGLRPYAWGLRELKIDEQQLAMGKLALLSVQAILPDGTALNLPDEDELPIPLAIPDLVKNLKIVLALPIRRPGLAEVCTAGENENFARHSVAQYEVADSNSFATNGIETSVVLQIGKLHLRLAFESEVEHAYTGLAVASVIEKRQDNRVVLDPDFCAPCLDICVANKISNFVDELIGLLKQRGHAIASRLQQPGVNGAAEIEDFLLLQLINRTQPLFSHFGAMTGLHPETLYTELLQLAGELATFTSQEKRPIDYPQYRHHYLAECYFPVMDEIRRSLSCVMDSHAHPLALEERQFGIWICILKDKELLKSASFVLAVNAQIPADLLRLSFPAKVKLGSVEKIRDLVTLQLPGIGLHAMPVAPRQLPFHAGYTYFELDQSCEYWSSLSHSAAIALHIPTEFPGLQMQFWAVMR